MASSLSLYILTYNCGCALIDVTAVASQLFLGLDHDKLPDLLVISLQEVAPLAHSFIGGSFLAPYLNRFQDAVRDAVKRFDSESDDEYTLFITRHVGMTAIMVWQS